MNKKTEILQQIKREAERFLKKVDEAIKDNPSEYGSNKKYAAAKRAALDLKNELTNLTQDQRRWKTQNQ